MSEEKEEAPSGTSVYVHVGSDVPLGCVGVVIKNAPLREVDGQILPVLRMSSKEAMGIGANFIYIAKVAEERLRDWTSANITTDPSKSCGKSTPEGDCVRYLAHEGECVGGEHLMEEDD